MPEISNRATIILGAGASKLLGYPLQDELVDWFKKHSHDDKDAEIISVVESRWGSNIEQALTILEHAIANRDPFLAYQDVPEEQMLEIKRLISNTFWDAFSLTPSNISGLEIFKAFLRLFLKRFDSVGFISLNWDFGLENALQDLGVQYNYGLLFDLDGFSILEGEGGRYSPGFRKEVLVLKPHGSVNWLYCRYCRTLTDLLAIPSITIKNLMGSRLRRISGGETMGGAYNLACPECQDDVETEPFIVPPTHTKRVGLGIEDPLLRKAFHQLRTAHTIVFVGSAFREADFDLRYVLASVLQARTTRNGPHRPSPWNLDIMVMGGAESARRIKDFVEHFSSGTGARVQFRELGYLNKSSLTELRRLLR